MSLILIVDDDEPIKNLVKRVLEDVGHAVEFASNGEEGVARTLELKPDLVLMDVMMPRLDGWEACRRIKLNDETGNIPVIILTVLSGEDAVEKSYDYALADDHIEKPFQKDKFLKSIQKYIS